MPAPSRDIRHEPALGYMAWTRILHQLGDPTPWPSWEELPRAQQVAWAALAGLYGAAVVQYPYEPEESSAVSKALEETLALWNVEIE